MQNADLTVLEPWRLSVWLLARILNLSVQASRSSFTPTTGRAIIRTISERRLCKVTLQSPRFLRPLTRRFNGLPPHRDLHRRADQDPYGVVLWVQQLIASFKRKNKEGRLEIKSVAR